MLLSLIAAVIPGRAANRVFLLATCLLFTILNITKELAGDLANYVAVAQYLANRPFTTLFNSYELAPITGSYRMTEIGFHGTLWLLSNIVDSGRFLIAIGATLGIYVPVFFALAIIGRSEGWNDREFLVIAFFVFFAAINFTQTTHLLRQYISSALVFLAFALFVSARVYWALLVTIGACLVHNGTGLLVGDLAILAVLFPRGRISGMGLWSIGLRLLSASIVLGASVGLIFLQQLQHVGLPEGTITIWHYLLIGSFFIVSLCCDRKGCPVSPANYYSRLAFVVIFTISLAFFVLNVHLLALRYFDYTECLFGLLLANILRSMSRERLLSMLLSYWAVCAASAMIIFWRVYVAPWDYGTGQLDTFTAGLPELASMLAQ